MGLFGKSKTPRELAREWKLKLRHEDRSIDRQLRAITMEENKTKKMVKDAAKRGEMDGARLLARELVNARKAKERFYMSKAQINSAILGLQHQMAMIRVVGGIQKSTEVMSAMNSLVRVPEIAQSMATLSREMTRAGIIEETVDDAFESALGEPDDEIAADAEINKVMDEILTAAPSAPVHAMPQATAVPAATEAQNKEEEELRSRLNALRA
eukprot:gnl/Trimastix_PCT/2223.p1 GENE.gnl/Trimastix_PCT/2223~~gnl/Trimastix_PCT/2223.p1  ORF type:complete len:212 (+),score=49.70 gnl/Trimastix_PCT/2223:40-675(+)